MSAHSAERMRREGAALGFRPETLEKVARLLELLEAFRRDRLLATRLVLKGGTALNLFLFDVPRLSVDVDLNYVGAAESEGMREERPAVEETLRRIAERLGFQVRRQPTSHAGGKWVLSYHNALGARDSIHVDLNYLLRVPLWDPQLRDSRPLGPFRARQVPLLDEHELAAGKLVALLTRTASRDLYDTHHLFAGRRLDPERLRLAVVVYGAMRPDDFRTVTPAAVEHGVRDLRAKLVPMLRADAAAEARASRTWGGWLRDRCREHLACLFPLRENEVEFIGRIRERGEIRGDLLTADPVLAGRIGAQPALRWRVRRASGA